MKVPSFEQFVESARKVFAHESAYLTTEQINEYFTREETQELLKKRYENAKKDLAEGKVTESVFLTGCAASAGNCLSWMYED